MLNFFFDKKKIPENHSIFRNLCGKGGIRTPGTLRYAGFQDRCIRPLYHLSLRGRFRLASAKLRHFFELTISLRKKIQKYDIFYVFRLDFDEL